MFKDRHQTKIQTTPMRLTTNASQFLNTKVIDLFSLRMTQRRHTVNAQAVLTGFGPRVTHH